MHVTPETLSKAADKTDKRLENKARTHMRATAKSDKRASVGSVGPVFKRLAIKSAHLGEVVTVALDERAAAGSPAGRVVYTAAEIEQLRGVTPDELRQVHEAKRFWSGHVTSKEATTNAG